MKIAVINTGGTISCSAPLTPMSAKDFATACSKIINPVLPQEAYDGWVILHGTDSMDFTGTALPVSNICAKPDSSRESIHHTIGYSGVKRHARNGAEDA